jgi:hypothetical protein
MVKGIVPAFAAAALLLAGPANAVAAFGTITFDTPTGTAISTASVPVFVTLTIDPTSVALSTGADAQVTSGLTDADLSDRGYDPAVYTNRIVNNAFECSGTFVAGCGSTTTGGYHFDFNFTPPTLIGPPNFDVQPGHSFSYLFGTFVPNGGNAAAGLYTFYNVIPEFEVTDSGFTKFQFISIATSCQTQSAACAFTRTITAAPGGAVPEPAAWVLMVVGFGIVGAAHRHRQRAPRPRLAGQ